ncbi:MAG: hypothetical protein ACT4O3_01335, partial [Elusimicrobiota bacterium]
MDWNKKSPAGPEDRQMELARGRLAFMKSFSVHTVGLRSSLPSSLSVFTPARTNFLSSGGSGFFVLPQTLDRRLASPAALDAAAREKSSALRALSAAGKGQVGGAGNGRAGFSLLAHLKAGVRPEKFVLKAGAPAGGAVAAMGNPAGKSFFSGIAQRVGQVWDRAVKGRRTVAQVRNADGNVIRGAIVVNRENEIVSVQPGAVMTVDQAPARVGGSLWERGEFVTRDGRSFDLAGRGVQVVDRLPGYRMLGDGARVTFYGDGLGGRQMLGVGSLKGGNRLLDESTGLSLTYQPDPSETGEGSWNVDADQKARIPAAGTVLDAGLGADGRLSKPAVLSISLGGRKESLKISGVLPNPETGGWQLLSQTEVSADAPLRLNGVTGAEPADRTLHAGTLAARQEIAVGKNLASFRTDAKVRQEGDDYVFTGGAVALNLTTRGDGSPAYLGAVLGSGSRLTVTGPTYFPGLDLLVYAGKFSMGELWSGAAQLDPGTLYEDHSGAYLLSPDLQGAVKPLPVKNINLAEGTFTAVLAHQPVAGKLGVEYLELMGKINFEDARASLAKQAAAGEVAELNDLFQPGDIRDMGNFRVALQRAAPGNEIVLRALGVTTLNQAGAVTESQALEALNKVLAMPDFHAHVDAESMDLDSLAKSLLKDARNGAALSASQTRTLNRALLGKVYEKVLKDAPKAVPGEEGKGKELTVFYVGEGGAIKTGGRVYKKTLAEWRAEHGEKNEAGPSAQKEGWGRAYQEKALGALDNFAAKPVCLGVGAVAGAAMAAAGFVMTAGAVAANAASLGMWGKGRAFLAWSALLTGRLVKQSGRYVVRIAAGAAGWFLSFSPKNSPTRRLSERLDNWSLRGRFVTDRELMGGFKRNPNAVYLVVNGVDNNGS